MADKIYTEETKAVTILGTLYTIRYVDDTDPLAETADGLCDDLTKVITVVTRPTDETDPVMPQTDEIWKIYRKRVLRHEILHAFLFESGLAEDAHKCDEEGWSVNEEMVDWFARMSPKIFKVYKELGII